MNRTKKVFANDLINLVEIYRRHYESGGPLAKMFVYKEVDNHTLDLCTKEVNAYTKNLSIRYIMLAIIEFLLDVPECSRKYLLNGQNIIVFEEI